MPAYKMTKRAVEDLSEIWRYTYETWSERQADKYYSLLIDCIEEIAKNPTRGKEYSSIELNIRGIKSGQHIIFYSRINLTEILVVRILHESMDLKTKL